MWFHSLLASWKLGLSRSRRPQPRPARRGTRLALEQLEDRSLPSSYSAATVSDLIADINAANAAGGANTISLSAPTTSPYVLTASQLGVAANDNLTIVGNGDTIERTTTGGRLLDVAAGASLMLQNLTLQGGLIEGASKGSEGGGIYNQGALTLSGVTVQDNIVRGNAVATALGGGIYSTGALTLEGGTLVQNNQALGGAGVFASWNHLTGPGGNAYGGGICVAGGTAMLSNVTLSSNTAQGGPGASYASNSSESNASGGAGGSGVGGALAVLGGTVGLTSVTISSNFAQGGAGGDGSGGYFSYGGAGGNAFGGGMDIGWVGFSAVTATLTNVTATRNDAAGGPGGTPFFNITLDYPGYGSGGGLYVHGGTVALTGDTVESNTAWFGGGVYVAGTVTLANDTVVGNSAYWGGGLYVVYSPVTLSNCTVESNNAAGSGGGLYVVSGTVTLTNDTLESNTAYGSAYGGFGGGGLYIESGATVYINAFTLAHVINNTAAIDPNIDGTYIET